MDEELQESILKELHSVSGNNHISWDDITDLSVEKQNIMPGETYFYLPDALTHVCVKLP